MLRIIHGADLHLDSPFAALPPEQAARRREEQRELLSRLADLAVDAGAQLVLLSGDLLDGARVYPETVQALARALGQIPCPVVITPGNHDPYHPRSPYAEPIWPANVHIFTDPKLTALELPELNCVVHGCAFVSSHREDDPLDGFAVPADDRIHIVCLHGDMDNPGPYAPIDPRRAASCGADYLALGHVHACSGVQYAGSVPWAYPGCPEGRGFDETGDRGVLCGTVEKGRVQLDFVALCKRRYEILEVDLASDLEAVLPRNAKEDIYRILLTGECDAGGPDLAELTRLAQPYFYHVTLRDRTHVRRDLWARAEEDTLTGLFLREMRQKLDAAEGEERFLVERAVRFGLAALENREEQSL